MLKMEDYRDTLQKAKRMVSAGDYEQARKLIRGINHPNRAKWLAAVDAKEMEADPFAGITPAKPVSRKPVRRKQTGSRRTIRTILLILVAISVVVLGILFYQVSQDNARIDAQGDLFGFCLDVYRDLDMSDSNSVSDCSNWAFNTSDRQVAISKECKKRAGALDSVFNECVIDEDILPPGVIRR